MGGGVASVVSSHDEVVARGAAGLYFPTGDHRTPNLSIPSISIHQPKRLLPLPIHPLHDINNLRHNKHMIPNPNQPTNRLIIQQPAPQGVQNPGAPQQGGPATDITFQPMLFLFLLLPDNLTPAPLLHLPRLKYTQAFGVAPPEPVSDPGAVRVAAENMDIEPPAVRYGVKGPAGRCDVEGYKGCWVERQGGEGGHGHAPRD
ncbi:hypothetical protein VP1G_10964 [Cytospora mali]|uniref:Uncharacterized protein n=1 Tax=Cytospora mali TaxID=578113 RepID=A0A194V220_CYTMA|nr:hypothetical protein VP1G_10964 [Valsa mali var. pyri (nom. inval.)]